MNFLKSLFAAVFVFLFVKNNFAGDIKIADNEKINLKALGVKIMVTNLETAKEFYSSKLGFKIKSETANSIELDGKTSKFWLIKTQKKNEVEGGKEAQTILTMQVNNLEETMKRWKEKGVEFTTGIGKVGVGVSAKIKDPFGNSVSVLQQTIVETPQLEEPQIYNFGYYFSDIPSARKLFVEKLMFDVRTEKYFPPALPLANWDKSFGFMLHEKKELKKSDADYYNDIQTIIVFGCADIEETFKFFKEAGINILFSKPKNSNLGKYFAFDAGEGVFSEVVELN
ncbi:MAG: hypothetical protein F9K45_00700 [Melioribacteraceae bacterium]|nr:MAG: hypothetical protein F9K45_00700 [Melioribacteraceae bacterium]